jgi:hypothetical protein
LSQSYPIWTSPKPNKSCCEKCPASSYNTRMSVYPYDVSNLPPAPPIKWRPLEERRLSSDEEESSIPWGWLTGLAIGFALLNFSFMPVAMAFRGPVGPNDIRLYLVAFGLGAIGSELGLLAIAAVFGPGTAWRRHLLGAVLVVVLTYFAIAGNSLAESLHSITTFYGAQNWPFALLVPILFYACQLPLWPLRSFFCWRIAEQGEAKNAPRLSIAGILSATGAIALALGAVRLGHNLMQLVLPVGANIDASLWWLLVGIWAAAIAVISLAVLPLFTLAIFRTKSPLWGVAGAAAWSALLFETAITIVRVVSGGWPTVFPWHLLATVVVGFTTGLIGPLLIVRQCGYRLFWGRSSQS